MPHCVFLIAICFLFGCSPPTDAPPAEATTGSHGNVDPMTLIGAWEDVQDSGMTVFREQWEKAEDGSLTGLGFVLSGNDTVFIEHLAIRPIKDTLHYTATIKTQNDGGTIQFKLVHARDSLVFTNPEHDFPQRIVYIPQGADGWNVMVSGRSKGLLVTDRYIFSRMPSAADDTAN